MKPPTIHVFPSIIRNLWVMALPMAGLLMWPAIWNGYPLVYPDSTDYLSGALTFKIPLYRSLGYALFLGVGHKVLISIWGLILIQNWILCSLVFLFFRDSEEKTDYKAAVGSLLIVSIFTSFPWVASEIMPDIFTPVFCLTSCLLLMRPQRFRTPEKIVLWILFLFSAATHFSHPPILLGTGFVFVIWGRKRMLNSRFRPLVMALLAFMTIPCMNLIFNGKFYYSRAGQAFQFARLAEDGVVSAYLERHCAKDSSVYRLCGYQDQFKNLTAIQLLWDKDISPLTKLGNWDQLPSECNQIMIRSLFEFPWLHFKLIVRNSLRLFLGWGPGWGTIPDDGFQSQNWESYSTALFDPQKKDNFLSSRQARSFLQENFHRLFPFYLIVHNILIVGMLGLLFRNKEAETTSALIFFFTFLLVNAIVCANFSGLVFRYQNRIQWLIVPALVDVFRRKLKASTESPDAVLPRTLK